MENRTIVSTKQMTKQLIIQKILWEIPFSLLHNFLIELIGKLYFPLLEIVLLILLQIAIAFLTWKFSISASFAKETLASTDDVSILMKNLIIFTFIECLLFALLYQFRSLLVIIIYFAILFVVKKEIMKKIN